MPRLLELAEQHCTQIIASKNALQTAQLTLQSKRAGFLPTLDWTSSAGLVRDDPVPAVNPWTSSMGLVLNENLYDNGVTWTGFSIARRQFERAQLQFEYDRDTALVNVVQAFYDWSTSADLRTIDENKKDLLDRQFNLLEIQYRQGLKSRRDVLRIETEVRLQKIAILSRDDEVRLNLQKLATLVGVKMEDLEQESLTAEEAQPLTSPGPENIRPLRFEDHKLAQIDRLKTEEAQLNARLQERLYWPQVALNGNITYNNSSFINSKEDFNFNHTWTSEALLTLTYNLWDFGTRHRNIEIANIATLQQENANRQELLALGDTLRDVSQKLVEFRDSFRITRELLTLEQQSYNILEDEYRNGRSTYLDLITNLNSLIVARSSYITTYFNLRKEQALYALHSGKFYETYR